MPTDPWETLLLAWLHDPVDKAADIRGHVARARRYAQIVFGSDVAESDMGGTPDHLASAYERLPMPGKNSDAPYVGPDADGRSLLYHPLSAEPRHVATSFDSDLTAGKLAALVNDSMSLERKFLTIWRLLPELFPETPADTRCPDHNLWQHLDTTAAIAWATKGGRGAVALLSFKISPVQPFIEASRSLRDLLSGSYLLSWLCYSAMVPVLESCGPTAFVFPALRGIPLMDWWLRRRGVDIRPPDDKELARASLPNRFLAIVPRAEADNLAALVKDAARVAWTAAAADVRSYLGGQYDREFPGWDRLWEQQISSYFDIRTVWLALGDADAAEYRNQEADANAQLVGTIGDKAFARFARSGQWQNAVDMSAALMRTTGHIRHIPNYHPTGDVPQKCTLFGTYEQMGPSRLADSRRFWSLESRSEDADRRCAIALVKKHALVRHLQPRLGFDWEAIRFAGIDHITGGGTRYYALLAMDGDDMGKWLSGEKSPQVREILHPEICAWYEKQPDRRAGLSARRPVSPSLHASISQSLTEFSVRVVPRIVEEHGGKLIYSGGDDLLAALPVESALQCSLELRNAFRSNELMGSRVGMSAGLAVAHAKEDLRYFLEAARGAERQSKREGKDRLTLAVLRRSGEHVFTGCAWDYVPTLQRQVAAFRDGGSDRWAYQMRRHLDVLEALDVAAFSAELRRMILHGENPDLAFLDDFERFRCGRTDAETRAAFIMLCQSVSFLARGKEER